MQNVLIGTSGYYYKDWENYFYPIEIDKKDYLSFYSNHFETVEINSTYYSFPNPYFILNMSKKVDKGFLFSIKAHSSMTHSRDAKIDDYNKFKESIMVLKDNGFLASILFQFPYSFKPSIENIDYLKKIRDRLLNIDIAIEFRNIKWLSEKILDLLKELNMIFCNVDEPSLKDLMPPTEIVTNNKLAYIRFHGRNVSKWYNHKKAYQRYDYEYSAEELKEWVDKIKNISSKVDKTLIYFNNHYKAKSARSGQLLKSLLS